MGMTFFEPIDNRRLLPLGGTMTAVYVGWKRDVKAAQAAIEKP